MVDDGETVSVTLRREFAEEAGNLTDPEQRKHMEELMDVSLPFLYSHKLRSSLRICSGCLRPQMASLFTKDMLTTHAIQIMLGWRHGPCTTTAGEFRHLKVELIPSFIVTNLVRCLISMPVMMPLKCSGSLWRVALLILRCVAPVYLIYTTPPFWMHWLAETLLFRFGCFGFCADALR